MIKAKIINKAAIRCVIRNPVSCKVEKIITGQPKTLTAEYSFIPLTITIKERTEE